MRGSAASHTDENLRRFVPTINCRGNNRSINYTTTVRLCERDEVGDDEGRQGEWAHVGFFSFFLLRS
jgi:hypothetical protein